ADDGSNSLISITNNYDADAPGVPPGFSGFLTPDVYLVGDVTNILGTVDVASQGSVYSQASINAGTLHITAGRDFVQSFGPALLHAGGNAGTHWSPVTKLSQPLGASQFQIDQTGVWSATFNAAAVYNPADTTSISNQVRRVLDTASSSNIITGNNVFIAATFLNINGTIQIGTPQRSLTIDSS